MPLRKDTAFLGEIAVHRREVRPFSDKQIALLQSFAAQAVIAIENARLITETREALEQQTATAEVLGVINSSPGELAPVFNAMLEKAMHLCTAAFGYLLAYDGEDFQPVARRGLPERFAEYLPRMHQPGTSGAYARIIAGADLVHVLDLKEGEVYQTSPLRQALVDLGGARTGLIVALRKDEALLGVFTIYRQEVRAFTDKEIVLLQNFAAQAVIAMENARLLDEIRQRQRELRVTFDNMARRRRDVRRRICASPPGTGTSRSCWISPTSSSSNRTSSTTISAISRTRRIRRHEARGRDCAAACPVQRALRFRAYPSGRTNHRGAAQSDAGRRHCPDLQRHHRA